jgi:hypothetical protein
MREVSVGFERVVDLMMWRFGWSTVVVIYRSRRS